MAVHSIGLHHFFTRKNIYQKLEKYPHPRKMKRMVDNLIYIVAFSVPLLNIPQAVKIWYFKDVAGISLISWVGFFIASLFWVTYGITYKQKPLIIIDTCLSII